MHNNIMAAGSRDRPPMLATGRYAQWQSHFLRYIDTRPNGDALRKCILEGPYKLTTVIIPILPTTNDSQEVPERTAVKTLLNMSPEKKEHYQSESKEIAKPITPPSESTSEEDSDPEQAQRDRDMKKNLALIVKYFKKIYKPTNNNLITSSNSRNKNVDTSPRETVGSQETKKGKKNYTYHKEKMLLCKQADKGVPLQEVPTADSGTDTEPFEKVQYDAEYNVFANARQHSEQPESINNTCVVEKVDKDMDEEIDEQELEAHYSYMEKIQKVPIANSRTIL
ncbi:hypothetical protein Tco_1385691 [Tanacetum coccineum]